MNKKGFVGPIGFIMLYLVFLILWFIWLGSYLATIGGLVVATNGMVGIEAFFYSNLNIVVLVGSTLGIMGYLYFTGTQ